MKTIKNRIINLSHLWIIAFIITVFLANIQTVNSILPLFIIFLIIGILNTFLKKHNIGLVMLFLSVYQSTYIIYRPHDLDEEFMAVIIILGILLFIGINWIAIKKIGRFQREIKVLILSCLILAGVIITIIYPIISFAILLPYIFLSLPIIAILLPLGIIIIILNSTFSIIRGNKTKTYDIVSLTVVAIFVGTFITQELRLLNLKKSFQLIPYQSYAEKSDACESGFGGKWTLNYKKIADHGWTFFGITCRGPQSKWSKDHTDILNIKERITIISSDVASQPQCSFYRDQNKEIILVCNQNYYLDPEYHSEKSSIKSGITVYKVENNINLKEIMNIRNPISLWLRNPILLNSTFSID